ncbi:MAG: RNA polymerase sigma factor, partial [Bacteroidota bacterium]|nr:RNA polymerase sigma factor [Bacteroidota bacterium]MDX5429883.1 RNA polymerase sigma factor [Bacteroidota bacterium]MDX5468657.1 RNA polymerase sigma factor [Bacteroidota bacterium]
MTEEELIQGCKENNRLHQEALYRKYSRKIFGICLRYASSEMEAEDTMQEIFIKLFSKINQYKHGGSFEAWVKRVSVNYAIEVYRRNKRLVFIENYEGDYENTYDAQSLEKLSAEEITNLIKLLPEGYRMVFNLYAIEGYTHKEIGEMMGVTEGTSKSQYSRAKSHLCKMLAEKLNIRKEDKHAGA